jgi:hypothetical protein
MSSDPHKCGTHDGAEEGGSERGPPNITASASHLHRFRRYARVAIKVNESQKIPKASLDVKYFVI